MMDDLDPIWFDNTLEILGMVSLPPTDTPYGILLSGISRGQYWFIYIEYPYKWNVNSNVWGVKIDDTWWNATHPCEFIKNSEYHLIRVMPAPYEMMKYAVNYINNTWLRIYSPGSCDISLLSHTAGAIVNAYRQQKK